MSVTVWCDGAANSETVAAACYCQETGRSLVRRFPISTVVQGCYADWAEIKAIEFAITEFGATHVYTDNKTIANLADVNDWGNNPRAKWYKEILTTIAASGCIVKWVSRDFNTVADWLSHCPHDAQFQLEPGLAPQLKQPRSQRSEAANDDLSGGRNAIYQRLLAEGTEEEVRSADEWILDWFRRDAKSWRDRQDEIKALRAELGSVRHELQKTKESMRKVNRCNSQYYNEMQRWKAIAEQTV